MKKIYCNQCVFAKYVKDKGYYCESPCFEEKKLIKACPRYQLGTMYQLIEEHFELVDKYNELEKQHMKLLSQWGKSDNPPLKLEELENGEWYWCEEYGWCLMNFYEDLDGKIHFEAITVMNDKIDLSFDFEENRFYRK